MNERIKELAKEAGAIHIHGNPKDRALVGYHDIEKFAELIVRECLEQCVKVEDDDELTNYEGGFRDGALLCYQGIKKHFGVEV